MSVHERLVVVTGCDSGVGQATIMELKVEGYPTIAICLTKEGCEELKDIATYVVQADITNDEDVDRFASELDRILASNKNIYLWGLVNNAGVSPMGYVEWTSLNAFRLAMNVNFLGMVAITKICIPWLKKKRGSHIVNVSSLAGYFSGPMMGAYASSKHAVEAFAKCLRAEMKPWGVDVCNINPAGVKTPMQTQTPAAAIRSFLASPKELQEQYGGSGEGETTVVGIIKAAYKRSQERKNEEPSEIAKKIVTLLNTKSPPLTTWTGAAKVISWFLILPFSTLEWLGFGMFQPFKPSADALARIQA